MSWPRSKVGFEDAQKLGIISNAYRALKPGGVLCILDHNEFDLEKLWFPPSLKQAPMRQNEGS